eukprot:3000439-Lingulodinium_polyedra.AAC.1
MEQLHGNAKACTTLAQRGLANEAPTDGVDNARRVPRATPPPLRAITLARGTAQGSDCVGVHVVNHRGRAVAGGHD